jgi:two-component system nitrate/nitrite response regulator NarL
VFFKIVRIVSRTPPYPADIWRKRITADKGWANEMKTKTAPSCREERRQLTANLETAYGRVLVVHDQALVGAALKLALVGRSWDVETTCGPTPTNVIHVAQRFQAQCVLIDVQLRNGVGSGIDLIAPLASEGAKVVMLTAERRRVVLAECLEAGAAGWIGMSAGPDEVDSALQDVIAGRPIIGRTQRAGLLELLRAERYAARRVTTTYEDLTPREALVLLGLTDGLTADEIARSHFVSVATVRSQIRAVLQKLGVSTQLAAVAIAGAHPELLPQGPVSERDRRQNDRKGRGAERIPTARSA